jgi:hypothetical protein
MITPYRTLPQKWTLDFHHYPLLEYAEDSHGPDTAQPATKHTQPTINQRHAESAEPNSKENHQKPMYRT